MKSDHADSCAYCGSNKVKMEQDTLTCLECGARFYLDDLKEFGASATAIKDMDAIFDAFDFSSFIKEGKNPFDEEDLP
mgnify:CR=1 FL=1